MSVFRVNLNQGLGRTRDGYLDPSTVGGYSIQRTIYLPGPNKITRRLFDGETFTDVNYWKRFTVEGGQAPEVAALTIVSDDGSVWSDYTPDNTFPRSYHLTVADGSTYADNVVDIFGDNGGPAIFTQISVTSTGTDTLTFRFNGLANSTLSIANATTQVFDKGDLSISKIEIDSSASGQSGGTVDIFVSVKQLPRS